MGYIFMGEFHDIIIGTLLLRLEFQVSVFPNVSAAMFIADAAAIKVSLQVTESQASLKGSL